MSERTTIGGTVYESVGSNTSNLLLRCNGTARIQWGNKLIDLIKNGKIASGETSQQIAIISDVSEIKKDGIYVLNTEDSSQLWISKDGQNYNLIGSDLYISASRKQNITAEQRKQALENIGMYYNTLEDLKSDSIVDGLAYVLENNTLYVIRDGNISEFEAKLKTVTVEKENEQGEVINSSIKIVLSILDQEYLVLENKRITANYDVHVKTSAQLGSEGADALTGYRLFIDGGTSRLEVDEITVRNGLPSQEYLEITFEDLMTLYHNARLKPHQWYLIKDYQNPWRIPAMSQAFDRPILIRALTSESFYQEGQLFKDRRVTINFDPTFQRFIKGIISNQSVTDLEEPVQTRGLITWMRDHNGNEANFDFLDYSDYKGDLFVTLHKSTEDESLDESIFPRKSSNNKITVHKLCGLYIDDYDYLNYDESSKVDFTFDDSDEEKGEFIEMHGNTIECRGFTLNNICTKFCDNTLINVAKLEIKTDEFVNNTILEGYITCDRGYELDSFLEEKYDVFDDFELKIQLENVSINGLINSEFYLEVKDSVFNVIKNSTIEKDITNSTFGNITECNIKNKIQNSTFGDITECTFYDSFNKVQFKNLTNCTFGTEGTITSTLEDIICYSNVFDYQFDSSNETLELLYDSTKTKEVYYTQNSDNNWVLQILVASEQTFTRGMIVMHSGIAPIPTGWAVCDGEEHTYEGVTSKTPNLIDRFIKGCNVGPSNNLGQYVKPQNNPDATNGQMTLQPKHLPHHEHTHGQHYHSISGLNISIDKSGDLDMDVNYVSESITIGPGSGAEVVTNVSGADIVSTSTGITISPNSTQISLVGGDHDHTGTVNGDTKHAVSEQVQDSYTQESFSIEPNYYSLIFIMKL